MWSPYYRIVATQFDLGEGETGLNVQVNGVPHQSRVASRVASATIRCTESHTTEWFTALPATCSLSARGNDIALLCQRSGARRRRRIDPKILTSAVASTRSTLRRPAVTTHVDTEASCANNNRYDLVLSHSPSLALVTERRSRLRAICHARAMFRRRHLTSRASRLHSIRLVIAITSLSVRTAMRRHAAQPPAYSCARHNQRCAQPSVHTRIAPHHTTARTPRAPATLYLLRSPHSPRSFSSSVVASAAVCHLFFMRSFLLTKHHTFALLSTLIVASCSRVLMRFSSLRHTSPHRRSRAYSHRPALHSLRTQRSLRTHILRLRHHRIAPIYLHSLPPLHTKPPPPTPPTSSLPLPPTSLPPHLPHPPSLPRFTSALF